MNKIEKEYIIKNIPYTKQRRKQNMKNKKRLNWKNIALLFLVLISVVIVTTAITKVNAEMKTEENEEMEEKKPTLTEEEIVEGANDFNNWMGFKAFPDPNVVEIEEGEYWVSSSKMQQVIVVWYENGEWKYDYIKQPHTRYR